MTEQGKRFAHELTMEYIRQRKLLGCEKESLSRYLDYITESENIISDYVEKNYDKFKTL